MRGAEYDLTAVCLLFDPCICDRCGHGEHEACTGRHTLFSEDEVACRCMCRIQSEKSGCDVCGVGADDECSPDCSAGQGPAVYPVPVVDHPVRLIDLFLS